jgi:hypothetical protein
MPTPRLLGGAHHTTERHRAPDHALDIRAADCDGIEVPMDHIFIASKRRKATYVPLLDPWPALYSSTMPA